MNLERLEALGFDTSYTTMPDGVLTVSCSQCQSMVVNGVPIHEAGCPNERRELECKWCGTEFIEAKGFDQSGCCSHSCWASYSGHSCDCEECSPEMFDHECSNCGATWTDENEPLRNDDCGACDDTEDGDDDS